MKKDKHWASKNNGTFDANDTSLLYSTVFEGYPDLVPAYGEKEDLETDSETELLHVLKWLKFADEKPPKINSVHGRNIYFTIVFESRDQKNDFLNQCDLFKIGDKYITGEDFAEAFGINLKTGERNEKKRKSGVSFANIANNAGKNFNFTCDATKHFQCPEIQFGNVKKKKEVGEKLKEIRKSEKETQEFLLWSCDTEYYVCIAFKTEKEKENMLKAVNMSLEFEGKYLWGPTLAKNLGIEVIPCTFKNVRVESRLDKKIESVTMD